MPACNTLRGLPKRIRCNVVSELTLVTIVCKKDLFMLEIQLRSLRANTDIQKIKEHIIIFNDDEDLSEQVNSILKRSDYQINSTVIDGQQLLATQHRVSRGWYTQQALKLLASKYVTTDVYIILDAKNHILNEYSFESLFFDAKPIIYLQGKRGGWENAILGACDVFAIDEAGIKKYSAPITPYPIFTNIANKMHAKLNELGKSAEGLICQKLTTEFMLYWVFICKESLNDKYEQVSFTKCPYRTLFKSYDFANFADIAESADDIEWFGIHLKHFDEKNKDKILSLWQERDLVAPGEDYDQYFTSTDSD